MKHKLSTLSYTDLTHLSQISGSASISELPDRSAQDGRVAIHEASIRRPGLNDPQEQIVDRGECPGTGLTASVTDPSTWVSAPARTERLYHSPARPLGRVIVSPKDDEVELHVLGCWLT